jgi:hypothetical protein
LLYVPFATGHRWQQSRARHSRIHCESADRVGEGARATNLQDYSTFITANGPVREVRFILNEADRSGRTLDGGVHGLYTIQGRFDAPVGCFAPQPDVAIQLANNNVSFRIPTPTFGIGLD